MARRQVNDPDQHQQAARHGVNDELERRVNTPGAAPYADKKIHRHQHDFPKNVKQEKVQRHERAEHAGLQEQHENQIFLELLMHRPGRQNGNGHEQGGEQHQKQADAVDADNVFDAEGRHPGDAFDELHRAVSRIKGIEDFHRPKKIANARDQR